MCVYFSSLQMLYMSVSNKPLVHFRGTDEMKCFLSFRAQGMQKVIGDALIMMVMKNFQCC